MRSALLRSGPAFFLVAYTACGESPATVAGTETSLVLAAHNPAAHGVTSPASIQSTPTYADVNDGTAAARGGSVHLALTTGGSVPRFPDAFITSVAVFGYAWADLDTGGALVSVIHPVIGRDSHQNPDGWHTHPVQLGGGTATSNFCVLSIGTSQGGIRIHGDGLEVTVPARSLPVAVQDLDAVAAFIVQADAGCAATGLGVAILDATAL